MAQKRPNDSAAFDTLIWIIEKVRYGAGSAVKVIASDHIKSEKLVEACRTLGRLRDIARNNHQSAVPHLPSASIPTNLV